MYFVRVDGCFGTVGGGGAEGNKSGVGRAGWREARVRGSGSSCQTHGPAPRPARPGRPAPGTRSPRGSDGLQPACGVHAPGCSVSARAAPLLRSAVSRRWVAGATETGGSSKPKFTLEKRQVGASQRRPRAARWMKSLLASDQVIRMRLWKGKPRASCHRRGKSCLSLSPGFCIKSKCNTHPLLPPHTSVSEPQKLSLRKGVYPGDTSPPPRAEALCGSQFSPGAQSRAPWRGRRAALMDYPSCPREGILVSFSATSVWPRICRNSDRGRKEAGPGVRV